MSRYVLKYFASGWWTTMASVDCSGCSCNSSDSCDADPLGSEQLDDLGAVLQIRAGGIAEASTARPGSPAGRSPRRRRVRSASREAELLADPRVPVLGQRLGQLDGQPVQLEVVAVGVLANSSPVTSLTRLPR